MANEPFDSPSAAAFVTVELTDYAKFSAGASTPDSGHLFHLAALAITMAAVVGGPLITTMYAGGRISEWTLLAIILVEIVTIVYISRASAIAVLRRS
jgi:hypothetical protein